jgi:hypothetical protein
MNDKSVEEHEEDQEMLTNELLRLTSEMKRNFAVAGTIIRDDNEVCLFLKVYDQLYFRHCVICIRLLKTTRRVWNANLKDWNIMLTSPALTA